VNSGYLYNFTTATWSDLPSANARPCGGITPPRWAPPRAARRGCSSGAAMTRPRRAITATARPTTLHRRLDGHAHAQRPFGAGPPHRRVCHGTYFNFITVWGGETAHGSPNTYTQDGRFYNLGTTPAQDTWDESALPTANAPSARGQHSAVALTDQVIIWGGTENGTAGVNTGARLRYAAGYYWEALATASAPIGRFLHKAGYTGGRMVIWGGWTNSSTQTWTGGRYDRARTPGLP